MNDLDVWAPKPRARTASFKPGSAALRLKQKGIRGIAAFLLNSEKLVVLPTPRHLVPIAIQSACSSVTPEPGPALARTGHEKELVQN